MSSLLEDYNLCVLTKDVIGECDAFSCGKDEDMDEFFREDALAYTHYSMGKSYCFRSVVNKRQIAACFTVSNDSIRIYDLPSARKNAMWKEITNREKMLNRFPGVLIGRLAVSEKCADRGIGSQVLDFLKLWFMDPDNKTACRLLIVDAKNDLNVLKFYEKNGFEFLFKREIDEDLYTKRPADDAEREERIKNPRHLRTRLMYFDLLKRNIIGNV